MHDYTCGVSKAFEDIVRAYAAWHDDGICGTENKTVSETVESEDIKRKLQKEESCGESPQSGRPVVNLLGVTPLDFSVNGSVESMQRWVTEHGMQNGTCLAMGCTLDDIARMPEAQVNLVVSSGGLAAAKLLRERFGTPYVVGVPFGEEFSEYLADVVRKAASSGESSVAYQESGDESGGCVIIGENVTSASLAAAIETECGFHVRVLCPLEFEPELLRPGDIKTPEEDDLIREIKKADAVIADPLYKPLAGTKKFYTLPHMAFSGRIYEKETPDLIAVNIKLRQ